jgi:hypothetical protein
MNNHYKLILLYPHLISCCIAIGCIFLFDIKMIMNKFKLDKSAFYFLNEISTIVRICLSILWITGLALICFDCGHIPHLSDITNNPKLFTKLIVVSILTINGFFLHQLVIKKPKTHFKHIIYSIGAVSAGSWFYAIFLGIAKPLNNVWGLTEFLGVYLILLSILIIGINTTIFALRIIGILKIFKLEQLIKRQYSNYSKTN